MSLSTIDGNEFNNFLMDFADVVTQSNFSTFPLDLKTVNNIIDKTFKYVTNEFYYDMLLLLYHHTYIVL